MTSTTQADDAVRAPRDEQTPPARSARSRRNPLESKRLLWLSGPAIAWFLFWTLVPVLGIFYVAFSDFGGLLDADQLFNPSRLVGTQNFEKVLVDPVFWTAMRNTAVQLAVVLPVMMPLAFMLGYFLTRKPRGWKFLSVFFFTPGLISIAVKGTIFYAMLSPNGGFNGLLELLGLDALSQPWLADTSTALGAIIFVDLWQGIGWTAVLFSAHMSTIPPSLYESGVIDGASEWRRMWSIAFPMTRGYFGTLTMLQFVWTLFNSAAIVLILTKGGPGTSSTTLSYLVFQKAFQQQDLGYSQAAGLILLVLGVGGMLLIRRLIRPAY